MSLVRAVNSTVSTLLLFAVLIHRQSTARNVVFVLSSNSSALQTYQVVPAIENVLQMYWSNDTYIAKSLDYTSLCDEPHDAMEQIKSDVMQHQPYPLAVLDGSCPAIVEELARTMNQTLLIIFSSTSINNNRTVSTSTGVFRTVPSDRTVPSALIPIMKEFKWRQLFLITSNGNQYLEFAKLLKEEFKIEDNSFELEDVFVQPQDVKNSIHSVFNKEPHIYFLNTDIQTGIHILCMGYLRSRYYPNYLWILPSWWYQIGVTSQWWDYPSLLSNTSCSNIQNIYTVLNQSFILRPIPSESTCTDESVWSFNVSNFTAYSHSSYAVDAALSLAVAIDNLPVVDSTNYTQLVSAIQNVKFNGASGCVCFDEYGDRNNTKLLVQQFVFTNESSLVVDVANVESGSFASLIQTDEIFPDGIPPDGSPVIIVNTTHIAVVVYISILCFIGFTLALACLVFNIIFRDRKIVKLTSPNLNYFLLFGVMILLSGMVFYIYKTSNTLYLLSACTLRRLLISIGHDIGFTVALVKAWRIHYIFKRPSPNKRAPKDWKLLLIAFAIVSVDFVGTVILLIPDNIYYDAGLTDDSEQGEYVNENGVTVEYQAPSCGTTPFYLAWLAFTFVFKITLHVIAIVIAFRIRNMVVDTLNDFKYTLIIIYSSSILIVILVIVLIASVNYINVYGTLVTSLIFLEVLIFLLFSFVPKMIALYKDPDGIFVFDKSDKNIKGSAVANSLQKNASITNNNQKNSNADEDSGRCTLDSKEHAKENHQDKPHSDNNAKCDR